MEDAVFDLTKVGQRIGKRFGMKRTKSIGVEPTGDESKYGNALHHL